MARSRILLATMRAVIQTKRYNNPSISPLSYQIQYNGSGLTRASRLFYKRVPGFSV